MSNCSQSGSSSLWLREAILGLAVSARADKSSSQSNSSSGGSMGSSGKSCFPCGPVIFSSLSSLTTSSTSRLAVTNVSPVSSAGNNQSGKFSWAWFSAVKKSSSLVKSRATAARSISLITGTSRSPNSSTAVSAMSGWKSASGSTTAGKGAFVSSRGAESKASRAAPINQSGRSPVSVG